MSDINQESIKSRIKELGLNYPKIEEQTGVKVLRLRSILQTKRQGRFHTDEIEKLSKILDLDKTLFGDAIDGPVKRGRPKPLKLNPLKKVDRVIIKKYAAKKLNLQHLRRKRGVLFSKLCRENGLNKNYITDTIGHQFPLFTIEMLDLMARALTCKISEIADIPASLDADYTEEVIQPEQPSNQIHWVSRYDPKDDPRYFNNPVNHVIPIPQGGDSDTDEPLADEPSPHIEHKINGVVAWRYQDGNAILFANEHIKHEHILVAMEQIKQWGEKVTQRGKL